VNKLPLILSLIAVAGLAQADLRSEIAAAHQKVEKAAMSKDIKGAEAAYKESVTSDFKYVHAGKAQDFKTFLHEFTETIAMTDKVTTHSTRIISLKENGNKATGEVERKMAGTMKNPDNSIHTMDWTGVFTEEYRKVGGKWKTAKMIEGKQKFLMDGKLVKM
jgi:hypothetical protein